ncbi:MAG: hypothetical protein ACTHQM_07695 [Thermoanaerobaculia bacterium]
MRRFALVLLALTLACSRETPAPATTSSSEPTPPATTTSSPAITSVTPVATPIDHGSYDDAMTWLKSNSGFAFTLNDRGVTANGEMKRTRIGEEVVTLKAEGIEWRAAAGTRGVVWSTRNGNVWKEATAPEYGGRMYQRVTLAFDPQKKEGLAQLASSDANTNTWRFTDANTGNVHELRVNKKDGAIERMKIGDDVELIVRH